MLQSLGWMVEPLAEHLAALAASSSRMTTTWPLARAACQAQGGDLARAHALYARYLPLMVFEQQPGVAVRKELYRMRGLVESAHVRHPAGNAPPALVAPAVRQPARPPARAPDGGARGRPAPRGAATMLCADGCGAVVGRSWV